MHKILVTGVNGFVGHHVARELSSQNFRVVGVSNQGNLEDDLRATVETYIACDLTNEQEIAEKIDLSEITAIINLAGFANVGDSKGKSELYNKVNVGVHAALYNACLKQGAKPRIIAVSTGAVYDTTGEMPITEEAKPVDDQKTNEYVMSKKLMEESLGVFREQGLRCIIARPFNHTGPGQLPGFLLPDLAEQLQQAHEGDNVIKVGNLKTRRDFTDVRDVAKAYALLATCPDKSLQSDVYNICSGKSRSGEELLELLTKALGYDDITTEVDPGRLRKNEVMDIFGSSERLHKDTGWEPTIDLGQTVADFVAWKFS